MALIATDIPSLDSRFPVQDAFDEDIGGDAISAGWYVPDPDRLVLSGGRAQQVKDRSIAGQTLVQNTAGNQPLYMANEINGKPALYFDATRLDSFILPFTLPGKPSGKFSIGLVMAVVDAGTTSDRYLLGSAATVAECAYLSVVQISSVSQLRFHVGTPGINVSQVRCQAPHPDDPAAAKSPYFIVLMSFDNVAHRATANIAGSVSTLALPPSLPTVTGADFGPTPMRLGGAWVTGGANTQPGSWYLADARFMTDDIFAAGNADRLATLLRYYKGRYELTA